MGTRRVRAHKHHGQGELQLLPRKSGRYRRRASATIEGGIANETYQERQKNAGGVDTGRSGTLLVVDDGGTMVDGRRLVRRHNVRMCWILVVDFGRRFPYPSTEV